MFGEINFMLSALKNHVLIKLIMKLKSNKKIKIKCQKQFIRTNSDHPSK